MKIYVVPDPNETKFQRFIRGAKVKTKEAVRNAGEWFNRNKEAVLVLAPIGIGLATAGVKAVGKHVNLRKEESVKNLYCYDRSLGHYWKLRRELTNNEWLEIDQRKKNGERLADILDELKVLK
jgi:hypothetical protein